MIELRFPLLPGQKMPNLINFSRAAVSRVRILQNENTQKAIHMIFAHVHREMHEPEPSCVTDDGDADVEIFERLVVSNSIDSNPIIRKG